MIFIHFMYSYTDLDSKSAKFYFKVLPMANSVFSENLCLYTFHTL